jgi:hypothetical protein
MVASISDLTCPTVTAGAPALSGSTFVPHFLTNFETHPRSVQGAGGVCKRNRPNCAGSNTVGKEADRFTGAK